MRESRANKNAHGVQSRARACVSAVLRGQLARIRKHAVSNVPSSARPSASATILPAGIGGTCELCHSTVMRKTPIGVMMSGAMCGVLLGADRGQLRVHRGLNEPVIVLFNLRHTGAGLRRHGNRVNPVELQQLRNARVPEAV